ncbi:hypothetical protein DPMN_024674 [Dreissena polymorpha]|uniref:Uncharacterized protein n=1 Tax=Dreissena polymorpha TaxID=45954 RepID=A0A9D4LMX3_DREPO|nr:hypothetical protein DPMN_024674 [Dreissena polymorpha]
MCSLCTVVVVYLSGAEEEFVGCLCPSVSRGALYLVSVPREQSTPPPPHPSEPEPPPPTPCARILPRPEPPAAGASRDKHPHPPSCCARQQISQEPTKECHTTPPGATIVHSHPPAKHPDPASHPDHASGWAEFYLFYLFYLFQFNFCLLI